MDFNLYSLSKELLHVSLVSEESIKAKIQSLQNLQVVLVDENDHLIEEALKLCFENLGIVCTITSQSFRTLGRSHEQKAQFTFLNLESCPSNISNKTLLNYLKDVDNKVIISSNPSLRGDELYGETNQHPSVPYPSSIHQFQVVNLEKLEEISERQIHLKGKRVPVSRNKYSQLLKMLNLTRVKGKKEKSLFQTDSPTNSETVNRLFITNMRGNQIRKRNNCFCEQVN